MKPRIGLNLLWLLPGEAAGTEQYMVRLLRALREEGADAADLVLLCNRRFRGAHPDLADAFETHVAPIDGGSRPIRIAAESTWLRTAATRARLHLVHHHNVVPWFGGRRCALTIHDLRPLERPETIGRIHGAYLRLRYGPSARAAAVITTPSAFVRRTVIERLRVPAERVLVVSAPIFPTQEPAEDGGVPEPFFVYPATTAPHKNHATLLEAFADVVAARPDASLVLTGPPGVAEASVARRIDRSGLAGRVRRLGLVPSSRLEALLRGAIAMTFPSLYEGFGLPIAEAMAWGCPVVASDATALPEVVGGAGILLDPLDRGAWTRVMLDLLEDDAARARLTAAGRARVEAFSARESARRQLDAYRLAAGR